MSQPQEEIYSRWEFKLHSGDTTVTMDVGVFKARSEVRKEVTLTAVVSKGMD